MKKRLYKSESQKMVSGVLGGIAEYFDIDPTLIRLGYVLLTIFTIAFPGLIAYIILAIIIPKQDDVRTNEPPYYSDPNTQQPPFYTAPNYQQPPFYGNNADNNPNNQQDQNTQDPPPQN